MTLLQLELLFFLPCLSTTTPTTTRATDAQYHRTDATIHVKHQRPQTTVALTPYAPVSNRVHGHPRHPLFLGTSPVARSTARYLVHACTGGICEGTSGLKQQQTVLHQQPPRQGPIIIGSTASFKRGACRTVVRAQKLSRPFKKAARHSTFIMLTGNEPTAKGVT